jgi:hypothetical protein
MTAPLHPSLPSTAAPPVGKGRIQFSVPELLAPYGAPTAGPDGYREAELFVSGTAKVYRYGTTTDEIVVAGTDQPYTTRIIVHLPEDPARFSGTAVLEIAHPEIGAGPFWPFMGEYLRRCGDAHVLVTTRRNNQAYGERTPISTLKELDPERYAPLDFEEGGLSWDIIAQVAALLRSGDSASPLSGLPVRQVIGGGYSGAGAYTLAYVRSFHERWRRVDGGPLFDAYFVGEPSWYQPLSTLDERLPADQGVPDIDVPVISLYTGPQQWMDYAIGPDTDRIRADRDGSNPDGSARGYRTYEIAGGAHVNGPGCGLPASDLRLDHVFRLVADHLKRWAKGDFVPPHCPRVRVDDSLVAQGRSPRPERDEHRNPAGGLRSTFVDVPRASYRVCRESNSGVMEPFVNDKLVALYENRARYVDLVRQRAESLVQGGWLLAHDALEVIAAAEASGSF